MRVLQHARRARRDAEGFAVPLESLEARELAEPLARHAVVGDAHLAPADLLVRVHADRAAEGLGHELAAEAVAEQRHVLAHRFADELERRRDPRQVIVHAHRAAHEHQTGKSSRIARHRHAFIERHELPGN